VAATDQREICIVKSSDRILAQGQLLLAVCLGGSVLLHFVLLVVVDGSRSFDVSPLETPRGNAALVCAANHDTSSARSRGTEVTRSRSHNRMVASSLADTSCVPLALNATERTTA